ncbi:GNA1162 family protein [Thermodesulfobacteriota bacterium]
MKPNGLNGMAFRCFLVAFISLSLLSNCSEKIVSKTSPDFSALRPSTIAVLPAMNETVDLDAPKTFPAQVRKALSSRGYRVISGAIVDAKLKELGVLSGAQANSIPDKELGELLNADAILFTAVTEWSTVYLGVYASITVGARFELVDAKSSKILWALEDDEKNISVAFDEDSAKVTAALAILSTYEPLVKRLVNKSFKKLPRGVHRSSRPPKNKIKFKPHIIFKK